jgi:hypothetical protein
MPPFPINRGICFSLPRDFDLLCAAPGPFSHLLTELNGLLQLLK